MLKIAKFEIFVLKNICKHIRIQSYQFVYFSLYMFIGNFINFIKGHVLRTQKWTYI
jgi:hypothetical protein